MPGVRTDVRVTGLRELQRVVRAMHGEGYRREVERIARPAARETLAAAIKAEAPVGGGRGHNYRDPAAARRPIDTKHLRDTVSVRKLRLRPGELFAFGVGPRGFTRWWVVRGTRPHAIRAREGRALLVAGGRMVTEVRHPGARGDDFVGRASRGRGATAAAAAMRRSWERYVRRLMSTTKGGTR